MVDPDFSQFFKYINKTFRNRKHRKLLQKLIKAQQNTENQTDEVEENTYIVVEISRSHGKYQCQFLLNISPNSEIKKLNDYLGLSRMA